MNLKMTFRLVPSRLGLLALPLVVAPLLTETAYAADAPLANDWMNRLTLHGTLEIEAFHADNDGFSGDSASDVVVATAALSLEAKINEWFSAKISTLYEQHATPLEIDEAYVTIGQQGQSPWSMKLGQMYLPFGQFDTMLVSDPLTLELGEIRDTGATLEFAEGMWHFSAFAYNGEMDQDGGDTLDNFGLRLAIAQEGESISWELGASYLNDLADSTALTEGLDGNGVKRTHDAVGGFNLYGKLQVGNYGLYGEYLGAHDQFAADELSFHDHGAKPSAWHLEAGYHFSIFDKASVVAAGYQKTSEALAVGLPEQRTTFGVSVELMKYTTLGLEWAHDHDYDRTDGGTGETNNILTAQIAVEF